MDEAADVAEFLEGAAGGRFPSADVVSVRARDDRPARDAVADYASRLVRLAKLYAGQKELILPGRATQGLPCARFDLPAGAERVWLPTRERLAALFGPALYPDGSPRPDAASRPTVLFFYGNAMCLSRSIGIFQHLRRIGANVMVPEYAGFGLSGGRACEAGCYATADAAFGHLRSRRDLDPSRIVATGVSLGGAVAIDLAARDPAVAGVIALFTFTSIPDMARHLHPAVPIWRFIRHKFDSLKKIPAVACPILIGHSTGDSLVPDWMADRLAAAAAGPVTRFVIEKADHAAAEMLEVGGDVSFRATEKFLATLPGR
jgi:fermentation-respiration switch protein FrsA (DUF1100 family)